MKTAQHRWMPLDLSGPKGGLYKEKHGNLNGHRVHQLDEHGTKCKPDGERQSETSSFQSSFDSMKAKTKTNLSLSELRN